MEYPILYPKSNSSDTQSIWTTPYHPPRKVAAKPLLIHAPAPLPTASSSPYVNRVALMSSHQLSPMTYYMIDAPRPNDHLCVDGRPHCWTCIYLIPCILLSLFLFPFGLLSIVLLRHRECRKCGRTSNFT